MPVTLDDFETIYREHYTAVWRFLLHVGVSRNDVADVTHNVFSIAYRKLATFEGRSTIRTWLCGIAFRLARDLHKSAAVRLEVCMSDPTALETPSLIDALETPDAGLLALAERLLGALPAEQREVFVLHELEDMTGHEIAAVMGTPLGTVRSRLRRARASFRKQLSDLGEASALSSLAVLGLPRGADASCANVEDALLSQLRAEAPNAAAYPADAIEQGWSSLASELSAPQAASSAPIQHAHVLQRMLSAVTAAWGPRLAATCAAGLAITTVWWTSHEPTAVQLTAPRASSTSMEPALATAASRLALAEDALAQRDATSEYADDQATEHAAFATTLAEEGRVLAQAHKLVQEGRGKQALAVLHRSRQRFPHSVLEQEREVLTTEALATTGAMDAAGQRAERFLERYPESPHAARLKRFVE